MAIRLSILLCLWTGFTWTSELAGAEKPNVLFIAVDDLNDWIGVLAGHSQSVTPNIDRLASRGVLFTHCYCAAPACNPSRAALMTGIRPSTSGVYHNSQPWRRGLPDAVTLPQHFMQHGYHALGSGKIYHGRFPDPPSWNNYFPSKRKQRPGDPQPAQRPINGIPKTAHFDWGPLDVDDSQMSDVQVADWVIEQLERKHSDPFFLACGLFRPHLPWYVPRKYFDQFDLDKIELPATRDDDLQDVPPAGIKMARPDRDHARVLQYKQWPQAVHGYLASIAFADAQVGRVLDALDASRYAQNTVIVFWTDHGWHLGEKHHWRKFTLWEEATRTPLVIVAPGLTKGRRCVQPVNLLDIYPTLIDLCGLTPRPELEGVSLQKLLIAPETSWERPSLTTHGRNNHAVRSQRYRYIRYADGSEELYDHMQDPHEWQNLADNPRLKIVKSRLARWMPRQNARDVATDK